MLNSQRNSAPVHDQFISPAKPEPIFKKTLQEREELPSFIVEIE